MTDIRHEQITSDVGCPVGYEEYDWIDWQAGRFDPATSEQMRRHLSCCSFCLNSLQQWRTLLADDSGKQAPATHSATAHARAYVQNERETHAWEATPYPSSRIYRALLRRVRRIGWHRRARRLAGMAALPVAAVCLALTLKLDVKSGPALEPPAPLHAYVQTQEPDALAVLSASDTSRYRIKAPVGQGDGYIWLSGDLSEAFLLLDRLPVLELADYQAWAVSGSRRDSLGLVKLADGRGHLYVQADILQMADTIALSAEPKGGSRQPTTEQYILLLLGR